VLGVERDPGDKATHLAPAPAGIIERS
jgi:hypothetical protein